MLPENEYLNEEQTRYKLVSNTSVSSKELTTQIQAVNEFQAASAGYSDYECLQDKELIRSDSSIVFDLDLTGSISDRCNTASILSATSLITGVNKDGLPIANFGEGSKLEISCQKMLSYSNKSYMICLVGSFLELPPNEQTLLDLNCYVDAGSGSLTIAKIGIGVRNDSNNPRIATYWVHNNSISFNAPNLAHNQVISGKNFGIMIGRTTNGVYKYMAGINLSMPIQSEVTISNSQGFILDTIIPVTNILIGGHSGYYPKIALSRAIGFSTYDPELFKNLLAVKTTDIEIVKNYD